MVYKIYLFTKFKVKLFKINESINYSNSCIVSVYPYNIPSSTGIFFPFLNEISLIKDLSLVKPVFSPGPGGVPACLLRFCANSLRKPLIKIFSLSLETSFFSFLPLLKKGSCIVYL